MAYANRSFVLLMVDDDEDDCMLVKAAIEANHAGCDSVIDIHFLHDGLELFKFLEDPHTPRPDLILLDLNMPRMDGREALKLLKTNEGFRSIPVVVFSTSGGKATVIECYNCGANSFIRKPTSFEGLVEVIRSISDYWMCISQLPTGTGEFR